MRVYLPKERPETWAAKRERIRRPWTIPFQRIEWCWDWAAYALSNWKFLEVLEYLSSLSILAAVVFYFSETGDRVKQKHYQAWQVINMAQGKGGSGGRIEALQDLNADRVPLVGVDVSGAFLRAIRLRGASLVRADFRAADVRYSSFRSADFTDADLSSANFRHSDFRGARFPGCHLDDADLTSADFTQADLSGATLDQADLTNSNLRDIHWRDIRSLKMANLYGVQNAPDGFVAWALAHGAVQQPESGP